MKQRLSLLCLAALLTCAVAAQTEADAEAVWQQLRAGQASDVYRQMSLTARMTLSETAFTDAMSQVQRTMGEMLSHEAWTVQRQKDVTQFACLTKFAHTTLLCTLSLDTSCRIWTLNFTLPPAPKPTATEDDISLTLSAAEGIALPAALRLPRDVSRPVPAVVLLAGSGPQDRDETLGENHLLRTLADSLAEAGIATIRWDKRTYTYGAQTAALTDGRLTLREEYVDDACAALRILSQHPAVDTARIFVLGHSLGGRVLPRVAKASPVPLAGVIALAAPARHLETLLREQVQWLADAGEVAPEQQETAVQALLAALPQDYLRDEAADDIPDAFNALPCDMCFLQGGFDRNVTLTDYRLLQSRLQSDPDRLTSDDFCSRHVEFHFFPNLDHLFRPLDHPALPADYLPFHPVSGSAVQTIVEFVRR